MRVRKRRRLTARAAVWTFVSACVRQRRRYHQRRKYSLPPGPAGAFLGGGLMGGGGVFPLRGRGVAAPRGLSLGAA
jgi:hypothetical protein